MTGESAVRRAEDIGGQKLSLAEVKAIASGNPAVSVRSRSGSSARSQPSRIVCPGRRTRPRNCLGMRFFVSIRWIQGGTARVAWARP